jgi:hypothetical protein
MNKKILSALGTLMLLSTIAGATLLPDGQSGQLIYKQDWLRASVQKAKLKAMPQASVNLLLPRPTRG